MRFPAALSAVLLLAATFAEVTTATGTEAHELARSSIAVGAEVPPSAEVPPPAEAPSPAAPPPPAEVPPPAGVEPPAEIPPPADAPPPPEPGDPAERDALGSRLRLHVSPTGDDANAGSAAAPLRTIQAALAKAVPGTRIRLAPGEYHEQPQTVVAGLPAAPITIQGPETGKNVNARRKAVVYGTGKVFKIDHSFYTLDGFTIDGQEPLKNVEFPRDITTINAFKDSIKAQVKDSKLIYVGSSDTSRDITGITIDNMYLRRAGTECIRFRNNAHDNTVTDSVIEHCGVFGKPDGDRFAWHNGEGVYIGTSPKSTSQPMHANDTSSRNVVTRNDIRTFGSECFNVKENAHDNVLAFNNCSDNTETTEFQGSNIELRGHHNIVRSNKIFNSAGVAVKIKMDSAQYDVGGNSLVDNKISGAPFALMFNSLIPAGRMCGNVARTTELIFFNNTGDYGDGATPPDFTTRC
jgi:hypothetical protein